LSQIADRNQSQPTQAKPATPAAHTAPSQDHSLSTKVSKLNLSVQLPKKISDTVQLKSDPQAAAEPGKMTDADVLNVATHIVKAATVHPLASRTANRELKKERNNLEQNKEVRKQAADLSAKGQQVADQDRIQQKAAGEQMNNKDGAKQADRGSKPVPVAAKGKEDRVIDQKNSVKETASVNKPLDEAIKQVQQFKQEHARSQSANTANASGLAQRNSSKEGERETLTADLTRQRAAQTNAENKERIEEARKESTETRASDVKAAAEPKIETRPDFKVTDIKAADAKVIETKISEARVIEIQQQIAQAAAVTAATRTEVPAVHAEEDDGYDAWESRYERKKKSISKKKQLATQEKRAQKKLTPLERRKQLMKRERARKMRKRSRRKNRVLVFK
jgi:hypothetical protein